MIDMLDRYNELCLKDGSIWKYPWLKEVCQLCLEYLLLEDDLADAMRASDIPYEILEIVENELE